MERIEVNMKNEIKICPFRTYQEVKPPLTYGMGEVTVTGFMKCLKQDCPAWSKEEDSIPCTGRTIFVEKCKRLE